MSGRAGNQARRYQAESLLGEKEKKVRTCMSTAILVPAERMIHTLLFGPRFPFPYAGNNQSLELFVWQRGHKIPLGVGVNNRMVRIRTGGELTNWLCLAQKWVPRYGIPTYLDRKLRNYRTDGICICIGFDFLCPHNVDI